MKKALVLIILILPVFFLACNKDMDIAVQEKHMPVLPETPYDYEAAVQYPAWFLDQQLSFINSFPNPNPVTDWGATLGRVLFYDTYLSRNNAVSCGSCHTQSHGFSDPNRFSKGLYGGHTSRNSMAIVNPRFSFRFFWDQRANGLENQSMMPILNTVEMDMDTVLLPAKLAALSYYPDLFQKAFGSSVVTNDRIAKALAQFMKSITSWNTPFDVAYQNNYSSFSQLERDGKDYFFSGQFNCNHCHTTRNFYNTQSMNNGLDSVYTDLGVEGISGDPNDHGKFKVPSLRNVAVTAPYMHDGRFATLEEVVEHYNSGIRANLNLDDRLTVEGTIGGTPKRYNMTAYEKAALVAFLKTLTDANLLQDPKYSNPFRN
ncbi:MAG: cytochrome c peroxidase [Bacteroidia bacterium]